MTNIIHRFLIFVTLLFFFSTTTIGQISKGDYTLDFSISGSFHENESVKPAGGAYIHFMKMVSNKIMIGGDMSFSHSFNTTIKNGVLERYPLDNYQINPTIRYYFSNRRFAPFISLQNNFSFISIKNEVPPRNIKNYQGILGLGFDYFLSNNIALEGLLTSKLINPKRIDFEPINLSFGTGIKLFFNRSQENKVESLPENIFKKGNIQTTGNLLSFGYRIGTATGNFSLSPDIRYFITDRFNIYGRGQFNRNVTPTINQNTIGLGLGAEYFFKLHDVIYWNFGITGTLFFNNYQDNTLEHSHRNMVIPISTALHFFHNQKRIYLGGRYSYFIFNNYSNTNKLNTFNLFTGLDYFVQKNIYFKGEFSLRLPGNSSSWEQYIASNLNFGVGFILD